METYGKATDVWAARRETLGKPDPGTRLFRAYGRREDFGRWFDAVARICEPDGTVTPGGVAMYVGVTRAGVHKRLNEGGLTGFVFHRVRRRSRRRRPDLQDGEGRPVTLIPVAECRAWADGIAARERRREVAEHAGPRQRADEAGGAKDRRGVEASRDDWRQWGA